MDWNQVVSDLGPRLYRYFLGTFSKQQASDLTQETLIRLVRKVEAGSLDSEKGSLTQYAYGIARLVRLEAWKGEPFEQLADDPRDFDQQASRLVADSMPQDNRAEQLREAIHSLAEPQKQILLLLIDRELGLAEIAELLAIPLNTIKSHIHRAKENLREKLKMPGGIHE